GELPAEELLPELVRRRQPDFGGLAVEPVRRLARSRDEAFALLAGRLGEQLFDPEAEVARVGVDRDLVPPVLPAAAELEPQLETRIALLAVAGLDHLVDPLEEPLQVDG